MICRGEERADRLCGVVLAAGLGTRLRPLTDLRPKPLCPLAGSTCLETNLEVLGAVLDAGPQWLAVNAFHLAGQVEALVGERALVSVEPQLMGTAGALALLAEWRAGRPVALVNGDAYLRNADPATPVLAPLLSGWDRRTVRMLVVPAELDPDFDHPAITGAPGPWRYVGACLLPADMLEPLACEPSGLHATVWQPALAAGRLELVPHQGVAIDTGTPAGYLAANLDASGGVSVVGEGAVIDGEISECVIWPQANVRAGERLYRAIRAPGPITVQA
ncbi:MAG: sugar phosphate nucleotidyltransferase [Actinomycetales bacterium]